MWWIFGLFALQAQVIRERAKLNRWTEALYLRNRGRPYQHLLYDLNLAPTKTEPVRTVILWRGTDPVYHEEPCHCTNCMNKRGW